MAEELGDAKTKLLRALKRIEPATARALAETLGVTVVAARQHLTALEAHALVEQSSLPARGRGRPASAWRLTSLGRQILPDRHGDLVVALLGSLRQELGDEGVARLLRARAAEQVEEYSRLVPLGRASLRSRLEALARQRSAEGYMAEVVEQGRGCYLLIEHHCPICDAAQSCQGLCAAELEVFRSVLGSKADVERLSHIVRGDARCVYRVRTSR